MKGDFTRNTFDAKKHFSQVLLQQGRVQLDADWNEQTSILLHYIRTLAADLIGPFAGPSGNELGLRIDVDSNRGFRIGKGRYYVDGILCENEKEVSYYEQADYPFPGELPEVPYLVYLDVWEKHVTSIEDDYIREKALGGPDTATRAKVVCQVKFSKPNQPPSSYDFSVRQPVNWKKWIEQWQPQYRGCLKVRTKRPEKLAGPCLTAPDAKYRGAGNQLYRVEIHNGGETGEATYKWSRDNGSIVSRCQLEGVTLILDSHHGFSAPGWIELNNDEQELRGEPGQLIEVIRMEGNVLTLKQPPNKPGHLGEKEVWPTKVRLWSSGALALTETTDDKNWLSLENGIEILFVAAHKGSTHQYRTGDYWLIPARASTGDIEWPNYEGQPASVAPHGVFHHYAPLAIVDGATTRDLRCEFRPLNNNCGLYYSYGGMGIGGHLLSCDKVGGL